MATRQGLVSEITPPAEGKKMWSALLGARKVWFWGTEYESEDPSAMLVTLRDAENRGLSVTVDGEERPNSTPGYNPSFTAQLVVGVAEATANGSKATESHSGGSSGYKRRDPAEEALIVAQNLLNRATDLACAGIIKVDEIEGQAKDMVGQLIGVAGKVKHELEHPAWPE